MSKLNLKIAMPKGRLFSQVLEVSSNTPLLGEENNLSTLSRKLVQKVEETGNEFMLTKPVDVPAYVEHGAADLGFTGKDVIAEKERNIYEVFDLEIGKCSLVVAVPDEFKYDRPEELPDNLRVATSYPNLTANYFNGLGIKVEIIQLGGSVELAPLVDLADIIVDITSTGTTLKKNNLKPIGTILDSSVRMIVNRMSYRTNSNLIDEIINGIKLNIGRN
ncbi:MAG: ATP phosphoribosyltransferase [Bacillota bacterium]